MPDCLNSGGFIYVHSGSSIYNWDPLVPIGPGNPVLNTINCPGSGLAVSNYLGPGPAYRTFYTVVSNQYWYYNGTAWTNTGHTVGNTAAVNPGGGGGFIYNLVGGTGEVYKYDGTGNGFLLTTVVGFNGGGPYDLVADSDGNWYILKITTPAYLRKYDPNGVLLNEWSIVGAPSASAGGGFAIVCNELYYHNGTLYTGTIGTNSIEVTALTGTIPSPGDFGSCELGAAPVAGGADTTFSLYRGCMPGTVDFKVTPREDTFVFSLEIGGSAINGIDYSYIDSLLYIYPGDSINSVTITPLLRNPSVGDKALSIVIKGENPCLGGGIKVLRTIDVTIKDSLEIDIVSPPVTVCHGDTITITATKDPILAHVWEPQNFLIGDVTGLTVTAVLTNTTRFKVTATYPGAPATCPPRSRYYTGVVEPFPEITLPDDFTICLNDSINFEVLINPDNANYKGVWTPAEGFGNANNIHSKYFDQPGTYTKRLTVATPVANCEKSEEFTITIMPPFEITKISKDTTIMYGDTILLTADGNRAHIWVWHPSINIDDYSNKTIKAFPKESTIYSATVFDAYGCKDVAYVEVKVAYEPKVFIPTAFSPNGDGLNDVFKIEGIQYERLNSFQVFDRYGTKVFETTNIDRGWDGTYMNGEPASAGVYYYLIELAGADRTVIHKRGDVTLVR
jgi:gliding motility-associated-like protein